MAINEMHVWQVRSEVYGLSMNLRGSFNSNVRQSRLYGGSHGFLTLLSNMAFEVRGLHPILPEKVHQRCVPGKRVQ